jgi:hypothetical protein
MHIFIDTGVRQQGPIVRTRVLNKEECGVSAVGVTFTGRLCFRRKGALFPVEEIDHVYFIRSSTNRHMEDSCQVAADFDVHTTSGEVIEVHSCDRKVIEAALQYAPVVDIRKRSRAARGL